MGQRDISRHIYCVSSCSIKVSRDFEPTHPVCLHRSGTDECEDYFPANGSFVMNKHNFTIRDMNHNLNNMNRLQELLAREEGPQYVHAAKRRGENIWHPARSIIMFIYNSIHMLNFYMKEVNYLGSG